jgi:peptidoglycan/xylan/chitin deacetylase (PgdA/CDA1 family)
VPYSATIPRAQEKIIMSQERKFNRRDLGKLVKLGGLLFLSSCAHKIVPKATVSPVPGNTENPTLFPLKTLNPTITSSSTVTPVSKLESTSIENKGLFLENPVDTPPSLMLHSKDLPQLINLLPMLKQAGYQSLTYESYYDALLNKKPLKNSILLSIDDLGLNYLSPLHEEMISKIEEAGMCGTLGIITGNINSDATWEAKPEIWQYLKKLQDRGWELANHTENHVSLPDVSETNLRYQIKEAYSKILKATGKAPVSLILPYGIVANSKTKEIDQRIFKVCAELGIKWVVGIWSGREFSGKSPFYVGRLNPAEAAGITMKNLVSFFGNS